MKNISCNFVFFSLLFVSVFSCFSCFGQLEKGTFVLKEHFSFSTSSSDKNVTYNADKIKEKTNEYYLNSSLGYLVKNNQEIGISIGFGKSTSRYENSSTILTNNYVNEQTDKSYGVSLYYQRYIEIATKLYFFASPKISYKNIKRDFENNFYTKSLTTSLGAYCYTGFLYRPDPKIGLSMNLIGIGIDYTSSIQEGENNYKAVNESFSTNLQDTFNFSGLNVGIQFMF